MYQFSERLKELRKRYNISQNALASEMGLTRATVNAWEMGISYPNAQSLVMLSHYFRVSVDYLLGLSDIDIINVSMLNDKEKNMIYDMVSYLSNHKSKLDE